MPPQPTKRIVCLAASRMYGGRCIAGKELLQDGRPGRWIRPVNSIEGLGLSNAESRYEGGGIPNLLDVMEVPTRQWLPEDHQRENWLIDPNRRWNKIGSLNSIALPKWTDTIDTLWINGNESNEGQNNRVSELDAKSLTCSLYLIEAEIKLEVLEYYGKKVQGQFRYNGFEYCLRVTDPAYEEKYKKMGDGIYPLGKCFLCISLALAYKGHFYKLIAAIIKP